MVANPFSFRAVWASLRALPGAVWWKLLPLFAIYSVILTISIGTARYYSSEKIVPDPVEIATLLILASLSAAILHYIINRLIVAHDQQHKATLAFLTAGLWNRYLLPFGLVWVAFLTAIGLPMYMLFKISSMSAIFWLLCTILALTALYVRLRLLFLTPIVAIENIGFIAAIKRSWATSAGRVGAIIDLSAKTILVALAVFFVWIILVMLLSLPIVLTFTPSQMESSNIVLALGWLEHLVGNMIMAASNTLLSISVYRLVRLNENAKATKQA